MDNKTNTVNKDELIGAAVNLDSALCLMQDITEKFFAKLNPNSDEDKKEILWEFSRYRAFAQAAYELLYQAQQDVKKNGITPYWD